jgi:hypothetical protein
MRPWTYVATEKQSGVRISNYFQASFDCVKAEIEFKEQHPDKHLEALLPGTHPCTTFETKMGKMIDQLGD